MPTKTHSLSKSRYMKGLQCHKALWLLTHNPELREESESANQAFAQGHKVGELAQEIFPGGVLIPFDDLTFDEQLQRTKAALTRAKVIYEAAFIHNGVFVKADIIRKVCGGWELYEVKGSSKVKDIYLDDTAIQYHVITGSGLTITKAFVVHLDTSYRRNGELDLDKLFTHHNATKEVLQRQAYVKKEIARQTKILKGKIPNIDIGPWCSDPYDCDFKCHCWKDVPEDSVFDLAGNGADAFALYEQGVKKLKDIPLDQVKGKQLQQVETARSKKLVVSKKGLKQFLDKLRYWLCR